jgi:hypothetical protein
LRRRARLAALRRFTTALMITTLQRFAAAKHFVQIDNTFVRGMNAQRLPPLDVNPLPPGKFRATHYFFSRSLTVPFLLFPDLNYEVPQIDSSI